MVKKFCDENGIDLILRGHQLTDEMISGGYKNFAGGLWDTIISAANYMNMLNDGCVLNVINDFKCHFNVFQTIKNKYRKKHIRLRRSQNSRSRIGSKSLWLYLLSGFTFLLSWLSEEDKRRKSSKKCRQTVSATCRLLTVAKSKLTIRNGVKHAVKSFKTKLFTSGAQPAPTALSNAAPPVFISEIQNVLQPPGIDGLAAQILQAGVPNCGGHLPSVFFFQLLGLITNPQQLEKVEQTRVSGTKTWLGRFEQLSLNMTTIAYIKPIHEGYLQLLHYETWWKAAMIKKRV